MATNRPSQARPTTHDDRDGRDERAARQRRIALIVVGAMLATFVIPFLAIVLL
ncbi:hypothetical protein CLV28_2488 [Sediminihabitans luteus]|uniref:Uncharacterized protein n=1 Tax=Sediminihabitans luteus TaxID=1138585 RepID=A0A2M9CDK4_9CELL|nr:hypothetical protein [Sediminihabitans luteus]PJJ70011.1 hypothetical protein CLV28_2488 [Sediminihabitans luteus]GII99332.1 hypothetical protein Slu03_17100 [Sediminihabitans luteus]